MPEEMTDQGKFNNRAKDNEKVVISKNLRQWLYAAELLKERK